MADWIAVLRAECERLGSQKKVATLIGYSPAVVNQVLKGSYRGDLRRVRAAVEGALLGATVQCPVVGELPRNRCLEYQKRGFAATNPLRVRLYYACRNGCPNSRLNGQD